MLPHQSLPRRDARVPIPVSFLDSDSPSLSSYFQTLNSRISSLQSAISTSDPSAILASIPPFLDSFIDNVPLPASLFLDSSLWPSLVSLLEASFDDPPLFDSLCFLMARIVFFTTGVVDRVLIHPICRLILRLTETVGRPNQYAINFFVNCLDEIGHSSMDFPFARFVRLFEGRGLLDIDFLLIWHYARGFVPLSRDAGSWRELVDFLVVQIGVLREMEGTESLRVVLFTIADLAEDKDRAELVAAPHVLAELFGILGVGNPRVVEPALTALFYCCENCVIELPVEEIKTLCRCGDDAVEFEAVQVLRVAAGRDHGLFLGLADFFVGLADGCPYRIRFQCVWAVCEFLFRIDLELSDVALVTSLLGFVIEQAEGEADLSCVVAWALRGLRLKFTLAGRAEEIEKIWEDCGIPHFIAVCEDLGNETLMAEIGRIDFVVSDVFQPFLQMAKMGMQLPDDSFC
jgi:hypothetical protein